jgi:fluoride exporter
MNAVWPWLAAVVAGGIGASLRFIVDGAVKARWRHPYPLGTTIINVTGSLVLGFLVAAVTGHSLLPEVSLIAGTGLLGGYTTFSTASFETVRLAQQRRWGWSLVAGFGQLLTCVGGAALGAVIGALL